VKKGKQKNENKSNKEKLFSLFSIQFSESENRNFSNQTTPELLTNNRRWIL